MRKLDQRGVAAFEFCLVGGAFFVLVFAIFDLGRYAITMQSLRTLASVGARQMIINCYTPAITGITPNTSPSSCTGDPLSTADKQRAAPFLFSRDGSLSPTVNTTSAGTELTVTARQPGFTMLLPIWGAAFNAPSAIAKVPF